ncbi:MAG: hypothetical protein C0467_18610 [Planctomycetaceae bacterium]|nr:hypothetical protein [Planctomycetaceae bacterium]
MCRGQARGSAMAGERTNDEIEVVTATGPGLPVSRRPMPLGDWILSQTVTVNDDDDDDDDELRDLQVQEAALIESVRLLRQQQAWLAGLDEQLTGLAQMVAGQEYITLPKIDSPYLDIEEAAAYARVSKQTIYNSRCTTGRPKRMPGIKKLVFRREDLDDWLKTRR